MKINVYLRNGVWDLPSSNHNDVIEVRRAVDRVQIHRSDSITWDGLQSKHVKLSLIYSSIRVSNQPVGWCGSVWGSLNVPKCAFVKWLAIKNRLLTKDMMLAFGMQVDPTCVLCGLERESVHHLFSTCPYYDLLRISMQYSLLQTGLNVSKGIGLLRD